MLKVVRLVKRGDKLPAEFRQEWLERNRELRKTASKLVASVMAEGNILPGEPLFHGVAALYYPAINEARAAHEKDIGKEALSTITEEKVLYERTGATFKPMGQLKVILTSIRKKELTPAQYKDAALKGYAKVESKMLMDSGILKIVGSFATAGEKKQGFDSMLEIYFASADVLKAAFGSPLIAALRKDEETFVDLDAPEIRMVAEEFVL
ncbi:MAG TPA: EthD domain-containing protein [Burkholderiales bacterium]|nr:EthD domain-containing protein [Burkholderiales bacterium]